MGGTKETMLMEVRERETKGTAKPYFFCALMLSLLCCHSRPPPTDALAFQQLPNWQKFNKYGLGMRRATPVEFLPGSC